MGTVSSVDTIRSRSAAQRATGLGVAFEVSLVFSCILYYIWRWQFTHPHRSILILGVIVLSQVAHRDSVKALGLTLSDLGPSARVILPLSLAGFVPLTVYGFVRHTLVPLVPGKEALVVLADYGSWCLFQQYLVQSYFHNRLMSVIRNRHLRSLVVGLMFGAAHIPNPILIVVTTAGGFVLAEVFSRYRNIWPLALAQAVGGLLVAAVSPDALIHNMRVGPGYFFYGLR